MVYSTKGGSDTSQYISYKALIKHMCVERPNPSICLTILNVEMLVAVECFGGLLDPYYIRQEHLFVEIF